MKIIFTNTTGADLEQPKPASRLMPDWYKNTQSYVNGAKKPSGDGGTTATIKKCVPVFDALLILNGIILGLYQPLKDIQHYSCNRSIENRCLLFCQVL